MTSLFFLFITLALLVLAGLLWVAGRAYFKYRGKRVVTCPETEKPVGVDVDARHAAVTALTSGVHLRLKDCTRWPERHDCGQECLRQIEHAPEDCLVRTMLTRWYAGKTCASCHKPIGEIHWHDNKPGLISPEEKAVEWTQVPPETLPSVLETYAPICWDCLVAADFRRLHPELVVDRDARWFPPSSAPKKN